MNPTPAQLVERISVIETHCGKLRGEVEDMKRDPAARRILKRALEQLDKISGKGMTGKDAGRLGDASHKVEIVIDMLRKEERA